MIFKIYDENKIRGQYFKNISFLKRYKNLQHCKVEEQRIFDQLNIVGNTSIDHFLEYLYVSETQKGIALSQIWNLISNKKIVCAFNNPLNQKTIVWLNTDIINQMESFYD